MKKRQIIIVGGLLIFVASIFIFKALTGGPPSEPRPSLKTIRSVRVVEVVNSTVPGIVEFTGRLNAKDKIDIYAEVGGVLKTSSRTFKAGSKYRKGHTLLSIDDEEARLNLVAQKSNLLNLITQLISDLKFDYPESYPRWQTFLSAYDIHKPLQVLPEPGNEKERYFIASRNIYNTYYSIKSAESRLSKYRITAPFNGSLIEASVNPGTLVRVGQKLGTFINEGEFELEAAVNITDLNNIKVGDEVHLISKDFGGSWKGKVVRLSDAIDPSTQSFQAYISLVSNELKEGIYLTGAIKTRDFENAVKLPRSSLINQEDLYVIKDSVIKKMSVQILQIQEDSVIVGGMENGTMVVDESVESTLLGQSVKPYKN